MTGKKAPSRWAGGPRLSEAPLKHKKGGSEVMAKNLHTDDEESKESIKEQLLRAKNYVTELGGLAAFKSGEWLFPLIQKSFRNYWEKSNAEYFKSKYSSQDEDFIAAKLIKVAARNTGLIGAITGATVSADEIVGLVTGGEGIVGIPANVAIAMTAMASEAVLLLQFQLKLVANLGKLYEVPLDPDDPEDVLTILAFAIGGSAAEEAGKFGMKVGVKFAQATVKKYIKKEVLETLKQIGKKLGLKILQRTILKYTVPVASIGIGTGWNYTTTRAIGKIAKNHFLKRRAEMKE
jgi:uncharacterized protein (DUF697 family)